MPPNGLKEARTFPKVLRFITSGCMNIKLHIVSIIQAGDNDCGKYFSGTEISEVKPKCLKSYCTLLLYTYDSNGVSGATVNEPAKIATTGAAVHQSSGRRKPSTETFGGNGYILS